MTFIVNSSHLSEAVTALNVAGFGGMAEVTRLAAIKMRRMEDAITGIIGGFSPCIGELKELIGHTSDDDIFAGREHW